MQSRDEEVWHWSDALLEIVEDWIREPLAREGARLDGGWHGGRLRRLRRQIESARKLYREGQGEPLRVLYSRWRTIAGGDMREQVKFALQDLPPLSSSVERLTGPPWARRRGTVRGGKFSDEDREALGRLKKRLDLCRQEVTEAGMTEAHLNELARFTRNWRGY